MRIVPATRRGFLRRGIASAAAVGLANTGHPGFAFGDVNPLDDEDHGLPALDPTARSIPILDTHIHLWDLNRFHLPWLKNANTLNRSFLPADYGRAVEGLAVTKGLYMEVDVAEAEQSQELEYVLEQCEKREIPLVGGIVSGRPAAPGFDHWVEKLHAHPRIRGIRQVLHGDSTPRGFCLQPAFTQGVKRLGEAGLTYDLCVRSAELPDAAVLVDRCPNTQFVLDHCGNASVQSPDLSAWKADLLEIAKRPNVAVKVSGVIATVKDRPWTPETLRPIVSHTLDAFGPDRVVFGGDWPVCTLGATLRQWILALHAIVHDRPLGDRRKLFHDNAVQIYGLKVAS